MDNFKDSVANDFVPIKGIFNEMFCKETSKSIKNSKRKKMQEGFYACTTPPYGYKKDPEQPGKLIIDKEAAKNVRKIFTLKLKGFTQKEIATYLNQRNIQTPFEYLKIKGISHNVVSIWTRNSVAKILCNKVYVGDCIRGKTQNISYRTKKRIHIKRNDFKIVENTHEPIITRQMYEQVHKGNKRFGTTKQKIKKIDTKFGHYIYCYNCGKRMGKRNIRGKISLHCSSNRNSNELCDFSENYDYKKMELFIINQIKEIFKKYWKDDTVKRQILKKYKALKIEELTSKRKECDRVAKQITFQISKCYQDRLNGKITEEEYKKQYKQLLEKRENANREKIELEKIRFQTRNSHIEKIEKIIKVEGLSKKDVEELITNIEIGKGNLSIHFKFKDINDKEICDNGTE